jgi:hypothetical protein
VKVPLPTNIVYRKPKPWVIYSMGQYNPNPLPIKQPTGGVYQQMGSGGGPYPARKPRGKPLPPIKPGNLELPGQDRFLWEAGMVYTPAGVATAHHTPQTGTVDATMWLNDVEFQIDVPPTSQLLQSGARYFEFALDAVNVPTSIRIQTRQPYRSTEYRFDEKLANSIRWHTASTPWPAEFKSALEPVMLHEFVTGIDGGQPDPIAAETARSRQEIQQLLDKWTKSQDLRQLSPLMAAKFITGRVLETFSPSNRAQLGEDGGPIFGFDVRSLPEIITGQVAQEEDLPMLLAGFLRTAGFPARTVYGLDVRRQQGTTDRSLRNAPIGKSPGTRVWTEFGLFDPETKQGIWIPVDIVEQRKTSNRAAAIERPWPWFGANEDSAYVVPIAFHLLPPLPLMTFGEPNFIGFNFAPTVPAARSALYFTVTEQDSSSRERNAPKQP